MTPSSDLFDLIKSLSRKEKIHFKLFSNSRFSDKERDYIKLFEAIDGQSEYDEKKIKERFKNEAFIKRFAIVKNYLYNMILESVRVYNTEVTAHRKLKLMLDDIQFLFEKGLYSQCEKLIFKGKEIAKKHESHLLLLDLLSWQYNLIREQGYQGKTENDMEKILDEEFNALDQHRIIREYQFLLSKIFIKYLQKMYPRSKHDVSSYQDIMKNDLLAGKGKTSSYQALRNFYHCHKMYSTIKNDLKNGLAYSEKIVELAAGNPHQITEHPNEYVAALYNLSGSFLICKKYDECMLAIQKLKALKLDVKSERLKNHIFYLASTKEMELYISTGEFVQGVRLITEIQQELDSKGFKVLYKGRHMELHYAFAYICFGSGNYSFANKYLSKIANEITDLRSDLYCMAKIMLLIIHFELGHEDYLEYITKSTHRYLLKKDRFYKFEDCVVSFMRLQLPHIIHDNKKLSEAFIALKTELEEITRDNFEKQALEYFDIISWLRSKIENRPFAAIVKEKAKQVSPS